MDEENSTQQLKMEEFKTKMLALLNEFAPVIGPDSDDETQLLVNDETQLLVNDGIVIVNWTDMGTGEIYLSAYPLTRSNPSMLLGMLMRIGNTID